MSTKGPILVVEDEQDILELLRYNLTQEGYHVLGVTSGEEALAAARAKRPALILLDLMLPGADGFEVCKGLKQDPRTRQIPIIIVTAKTEEADVVAGLEVGADDFITKPFSPRVLSARVKAVLRRKRHEPLDERVPIRLRDLTVDPGRHEVLVKGRAVSCTATEFRVLHFLARRPGWVFTRYQIVEGVRGDDYAVTDRSVDVLLVGLRKKLGVYGGYIETVRGVGYRFKDV